MTHEPASGTAGPMVAVLHPHRRPGVLYGGVAVVLLVVVALGAASYLGSGRYAMGAVTVVVGLGVTAFLVGLALALVLPELRVGPAGVAGRVGWGRSVDVGWDAVLVDVDEDAPRARFRLDLGGESLVVDARSWLGFGDLVLVLATTPAAARRLTPTARRELARLLGLGDQG